MGALLKFLTDNFIYIVFIAIIIVLGLIGYVIDKSKTKKIKTEFEHRLEQESNDLPIANIDAGVKLGESVNRLASVGTNSVNQSEPEKTTTTAYEPPKI